jgi:hypothetical protein
VINGEGEEFKRARVRESERQLIAIKVDIVHEKDGDIREQSVTLKAKREKERERECETIKFCEPAEQIVIVRMMTSVTEQEEGVWLDRVGRNAGVDVMIEKVWSGESDLMELCRTLNREMKAD